MIFCQKRSLCQNNIHPWTTFPLRNTTNLGAVPWPPENFQEEKIHFLEDQWTFTGLLLCKVFLMKSCEESFYRPLIYYLMVLTYVRTFLVHNVREKGLFLSNLPPYVLLSNSWMVPYERKSKIWAFWTV